MKYIGFALLAVLAVLVVLIVFAAMKAVKIKAKPNTSAPAINPTEEEANTYAKKLSEMVKVPTISLRGNEDLTQFYKLHEVMKENFPLVFSKLECTEIDGNLLFRWPGKDPKRNGLLLKVIRTLLLQMSLTGKETHFQAKLQMVTFTAEALWTASLLSFQNFRLLKSF